MVVDILHDELLKEASIGLSEMFLDQVIPAFFNSDKDGVLLWARMTTSNSELTAGFSYLQNYVDGNE